MHIFSKNKNAQRLLIVAALVLILSSLLITANNLFAQNIEPRALQISDLPAKSQPIEVGYVGDTKLVSHPLHRYDDKNSPFTARVGQKKTDLYEYSQVYQFSAFAPEEGVYVGNWLYTYPSQSQAQSAAALMIQEMHTAQAELVREGMSLSKNVKGKVFQVTGDAGDSIYWFVGVDHNTLYLVLANGLNDQNTAKVFTEALQLSLPTQ